jgi:hypothetical protein
MILHVTVSKGRKVLIHRQQLLQVIHKIIRENSNWAGPVGPAGCRLAPYSPSSFQQQVTASHILYKCDVFETGFLRAYVVHLFRREIYFIVT